MFFVLSESSLAGIYLEVVSADCEIDYHYSLLLAQTSWNNFAAIASLLSYSVKSSRTLVCDSPG